MTSEPSHPAHHIREPLRPEPAQRSSGRRRARTALVLSAAAVAAAFVLMGGLLSVVLGLTAIVVACAALAFGTNLRRSTRLMACAALVLGILVLPLGANRIQTDVRYSVQWLNCNTWAANTTLNPEQQDYCRSILEPERLAGQTT